MRTFALTAVLAASTCAWAQPPSSWAPLPLAQTYNGLVVQQLGKTILYPDAGRWHAFRSQAKTWVPLPGVPTTAASRIANDLALVQEATRWHAFSSYRGVWESIAVGANATLLNPATQRNDSLWVGRDGGDLVVFSCFTGRWQRRAVSLTATVAVQRHTLVVADGASLLAMSAFDGQWRTATASAPVTQVQVDGTVGVVEAGAEVWGFSAQRAAWARAAAVPNATRTVGADVAVWSNGSQVLGFSGTRGAFALAAGAVVGSFLCDERVAWAHAGGGFLVFNGLVPGWTLVPASAAAVAIGRTDVVLVHDGLAAVRAFSTLRNSVATLLGSFTNVAVNTTLASAAETATGKLWFFSSFTGQWVQAPPDVTATGNAELAWNAALVPTATGFRAFSARTGRFVSLPTTGTAISHVDLNSSILSVEEAARFSVWEPRRETWLSVPRTGTGFLNVRIWRSTVVAVDGQDAYAFASLGGTLETVTIPGAIVDVNANSESLRVATANTLYAFGGTSELTTYAQFPEFRRLWQHGSPLDVTLVDDPGGVAALVLGFAPITAVPLPFGELLIDPSLLLIVPMPALDADGRSLLHVPLPDDPALAGVEALLQAFVVPPARAPFLSRLAHVSIW